MSTVPIPKTMRDRVAEHLRRRELRKSGQVTITIDADISAYLDGLERVAEELGDKRLLRRIRHERNQGLSFVRTYAERVRADLGLSDRMACPEHRNPSNEESAE